MAHNPRFFGADSSAGSSSSPDQDAAIALSKFQLDAFRKPDKNSTSLVAQALEQNPEPPTNYVQQAAEQNLKQIDPKKPGNTTLVQQAAEQNPKTTIADQINGKKPEPATNFVLQAAEQNPKTKADQTSGKKPEQEPPTNYVLQAAEQNPKTIADHICGQKFVPGSTTLVQQARDQNPVAKTGQLREPNAPGMQQLHLGEIGANKVLPREPKAPGIHQFYLDDIEVNKKQPGEQRPVGMHQFFRDDIEANRKPGEQPVQGMTKFFEDDMEANRKQARAQEMPGLGKFFKDDLETNLIQNVAQVLGRANVFSDLDGGRKSPILLGTVGELFMPRPEDFWHGPNSKADMTDYVRKGSKAYEYDPKTVGMALDALDRQIKANLKSVKSGQPMDQEQQDRMRQLVENTALIKLGVAQQLQATKPDEARALLSGKGQSVTELIKTARNFGANEKNLEQIKNIADKIGR